ncbi:biotin synthase [Wolbachia endosymbiont of Cimex lectularius]|uniref:Biotin synthase n=4 Tax=unclassified Wolbachia TaxID=2640676 RepID=A0A060Q5X9_9RICK|nr:biotin synthase BioB [Wolbachia endosymbiont of Cimex lectularius]BAP00148.1 biotin synthase [Wolbachia endosymbiont of Cimex lectularius]BAP01350.1 biotin synthase [Wolbachia sp. SYDL]BAP01358.1 biotin synthase [Wolbachia sp. TUA]BAP01366.1 biotin synthase [Wolbachia sp. TIH]
MTEEWTFAKADQIFNFPFPELIYIAQTEHRKQFNPSEVQISTLLSIKTGSCPENCSYCPQSAHYNTGLQKKPLLEIAEVIEAAKCAKEAGSTRFCMGAAWRGPRDQDLKVVCEMIREVKKLGLETCVTLGLLKDHQANMLKEAGLDFYNHNIDTSEEYYNKVITTRTFQDRLETLECVRASGIKVCCGGILGMGETNEDRIKMLVLLANLNDPPESVPINTLIKIPGTPLENVADVDPFDFVRTIAIARIIMPKSYIRLSAGREKMSDELQALCFLAGANSIFYGEKLLTAQNPIPEQDNHLFQRLGLQKLALLREN